MTSLIIFLSFSFTNGQGQEVFDLFAHFDSYESIKTNQDKYVYLEDLTNKAKSLSQSNLDVLLSKKPLSFIERFTLAEYWRSKKENQKAKVIFENLETDILGSEPRDNILLAMIRWNCSYNFSLNDFSYEKSLEDLNAGLNYAEKSGVDSLTIRIHSNLQFYYTMLADYEKSLFHNKKQHELARKLGDTTRIILALESIMMDLNTTQNNENALKLWNQIRPILKDFPNYRGKPKLYSIVTDIYIRLQQLDSARFYNDLCFKIDSASDNLYNMSKNLYYKGKILIQSNQFPEAKDVFLSSIKVAKENRNKSVEALSSTELAQIYLNEGRAADALELLKPTYKTGGRLNNLYKGHLELMLSKAYEASGVLDSALYYRNMSDATRELSNRESAKKEAALAKVELDVENYIQMNQNLELSNEALNERVTKITTTQKILIYSFLAMAIIAGFIIYRKNHREKLRLSQINEQLSAKERMVIEAELNSIRSQMNPHFMFNSLNSINEFIQNDSSEDASNYLVKFSRLMRSTLNYSKRKFVTLKEEIDLLKLYLELESLRFYNSIDYSFNIEKEIDLNETFIPPMMLQPFVENAIWHGLMAKEGDRKLELRIYGNSDHLICEIEDNGIGRAASAKQNLHKSKHKSQGMGLTSRRLELLKSIHGKEAGVEIIDLMENDIPSGTLVKVTLPKEEKQ